MMEEINLFKELYIIKNELDKDLALLDKIQNDLKVRVVYDNNKELADRIHTLTGDYSSNINEMKNKRSELEKELSLKNNIIQEKDKEILKLRDKLNEIFAENKNLDINVNRIKSENSRMEKILQEKEERADLERKNREYLRNLFDKELNNK